MSTTFQGYPTCFNFETSTWNCLSNEICRIDVVQVPPSINLSYANRSEIKKTILLPAGFQYQKQDSSSCLVKLSTHRSATLYGFSLANERAAFEFQAALSRVSQYHQQSSHNNHLSSEGRKVQYPPALNNNGYPVTSQPPYDIRRSLDKDQLSQFSNNGYPGAALHQFHSQRSSVKDNQPSSDSRKGQYPPALNNNGYPVTSQPPYHTQRSLEREQAPQFSNNGYPGAALHQFHSQRSSVKGDSAHFPSGNEMQGNTAFTNPVRTAPAYRQHVAEHRKENLPYSNGNASNSSCRGRPFPLPSAFQAAHPLHTPPRNELHEHEKARYTNPVETAPIYNRHTTEQHKENQHLTNPNTSNGAYPCMQYPQIPIPASSQQIFPNKEIHGNERYSNAASNPLAAPGSWNCHACTFENHPTFASCISCTTPKAGAYQPPYNYPVAQGLQNDQALTQELKRLEDQQMLAAEMKRMNNYQVPPPDIKGNYQMHPRGIMDTYRMSTQQIKQTNNIQIPPQVINTLGNFQAPRGMDGKEMICVNSSGWICDSCTLQNDATFANCAVCMTNRPVDYQIPPNHQTPPEELRGIQKLQQQQPQMQDALKNLQQVPQHTIETEHAKTYTGDGWICQSCTFENSATFMNCKACTERRPNESAGVAPLLATAYEMEGWNCGACTLRNFPTIESCETCQTQRPAEYKVPDNYEMLPEELAVKLEGCQISKEEMRTRTTVRQALQVMDVKLFPNHKQIKCPFCKTDVKEGVGAMLCDCLHCFCKDCLIKQIEASEKLDVKCLHNQCPSFITEGEIKELLSADDYVKYLERCLAAAERDGKETLRCRKANCPSWCFVELFKRNDMETFECPMCGCKNCLNCKANHAGTSCKEYQEMLRTYPKTWVIEDQVDDKVLFEMDPNSEEWRMVEDRFNGNLKRNCQVEKIQRCQNKRLWKKYDFQKKMMAEKNGAENVNEKLLFHGTRACNPAVVWKGNEGFDMRFCVNGAWGRGSYFAEDAEYSIGYAYIEGNKKQMFMAYVLTGFANDIPPNGTLTMPPIRNTSDDGIQVRYDSVSGMGSGTKIYIVYQLDVAYPAYLITFT